MTDRRLNWTELIAEFKERREEEAPFQANDRTDSYANGKNNLVGR